MKELIINEKIKYVNKVVLETREIFPPHLVQKLYLII